MKERFNGTEYGYNGTEFGIKKQRCFIFSSLKYFRGYGQSIYFYNEINSNKEFPNYSI